MKQKQKQFAAMMAAETREAASPPAPAAERPDMVGAVLHQLTEHIVAGNFGPDGVLPPEGELATSFGVSRTVIREAMRSLRAQGLVEVSQGRPPRTKPPDPKAAIASLEILLRRNQASLLHLMEVRHPLESEIAALAAERANEVHLRQLELTIHELAAARSLDQRIEADCKFHRCLAEATGNPVFVLLLETLTGFLHESRRKTLAYSGVEIALDNHRAIYQAVLSRDAAKARAAMQDHLHLAARDLDQIQTRKNGNSAQ